MIINYEQENIWLLGGSEKNEGREESKEKSLHRNIY